MADNSGEYEGFKIREYPCWTLYLHSNQYYLGRCYAWLKRDGDMQRLSDLTCEELFELHGSVLPGYESAVGRLWSPDHMNYAWLGNHVHAHKGHGHMHLIPRYKRPVLFSRHEFSDGQWGQNYP
ncbi:MAG: hypothetical protein WAX57_02230, partial [Minisyncoccia bacterium]